MLKKIISKILIIISNILVLFISIFIPKSENILIFGSWLGNRFCDNTRYLYMYCSHNKDKIGLDKVVWITNNNDIISDLREKGMLVFKKNSLKGIWYHLRSKYHFIDQEGKDINWYFSCRAKRIQLWHGVGFKKITQLDSIPKIDLNYKLKYFLKTISTPGFWNKYTFLSTSKFATENIFNMSFRLWENDVVEANYPRNCYLKEICKDDDELYIDKKQMKCINIIKEKIKEGKRIVLYLPTYRQKTQLDNNNKKISIPFNLDTESDFEMFNEFLNNEEFYMISKFHSSGDKSNIEFTDSFLNLESDIDIYPLLKYVDILITDYSSIYADFLFLDKPIIFYAYDLIEYENQDKGFLFKYADITPGPKAFNIDELKEKLVELKDLDEYGIEREMIKKMYFGENINDKFIDILNKIRK